MSPPSAGAADTGADQPPWWLLEPIGPGTPLGLGWSFDDLTRSDGALVLRLKHSSGRRAIVHAAPRQDDSACFARTRHHDLFLMDGSEGTHRTDEKLGRVVLGIAERITRNEDRIDGSPGAEPTG